MTEDAVEVRDGRPVLVRRAAGADAATVRAEWATLSALAGTGVPTIVHYDDVGDEVRLVTTLAAPLATAAMDEPALAATLAAVADVLGRAHELGIVHGPIEDADVRWLDGNIQLTGWTTEPGPIGPADDVAALGALLERVSRTPGLRSLARRATADAPDARPSMSAVAGALREMATPTQPRTVSRPDRRRVLAGSAIGLTLAVALVVGGSVARHTGTTQRPSPPTEETVRPVRSSTTTTTEPPARPVSVEVRMSDNVLDRDGVRWTVGRPGDVVALGDWNCDGTATPAVLRPATGRVWVFAAWPGDGTPVAGTSMATVPGAAAFRVRAVGRCDRLEVIDREGQSTAVG